MVQLLTQMSTELDRLAQEVSDSRAQAKQLFEQGSRHLARMRELVSSSGPIETRANAFGEEALKLIGQITALQQTSVAPSVKRAADDLGKTFIAPIADGARRRPAAAPDRGGRAGSRSRSRRRARRWRKRPTRSSPAEPVVPPRFQPLSPPEAVLRYAGDFLPSWAGAISIDLMPAVLIFIMVIVEGSIRRHSGTDLDAETMTAADVIRGTEIFRQMQARFAAESPPPPRRPAASWKRRRSRGAAARHPMRRRSAARILPASIRRKASSDRSLPCRLR